MNDKEAWVRFAAGYATSRAQTPAFGAEQACHFADLMLEEMRKRNLDDEALEVRVEIDRYHTFDGALRTTMKGEEG